MSNPERVTGVDDQIAGRESVSERGVERIK